MTYCTMLLTARTENIIIDCVMRHLLMWIKVRYDMFTVKLILDFIGNFFRIELRHNIQVYYTLKLKMYFTWLIY